MNKIYKLKFDKRRNELVVVSEITAGMGKEKSTGHIADLSALSPFRKLPGTLTPLALLTGLIISLFPGMALAADLPTGGQIVGGQGSISTSGNQMTIHQQTQNMATNWHSFDVGKNNTVQFVQPDSSSVALNRVTGASGSQIMGTLKANGQVFILNPNGVLFGKDARVNVAGLVASTKNINTADFMKGQYTLSGSGNPGAQVVNQGSLTTSKGGYIVLAGERVSNSGTVTTPGGKTVLAAGKTVTLQLDNGGLTSVSVNGSVVNALVENRGLISATNGQVYLTAKGQDMLLNTVVNNSGTIEAKGLESRGGEIVLNGGDSGVVSQSGQLLADSQTGQGGKVILEGQNIHLAGSSLTSATGKTGGGEVYVGGGWQGKDSVIKNASKVVMDQAATVDVSATDAGNGGTAVLWSDDYTNFRGTVLAKGGAQSGNGGRVETSSHNNLQAFGDVNTSASSGKGGEWLLDPMDVTIVTAEDNTSVIETGKDAGGAGLDSSADHVFSPSALGAQVSATKIQGQLNNGTSVTVDTHGGEGSAKGNITIADNVNITKNKGDGNATLTLLADNNIQLGSDPWGNKPTNITISSTSGKLNLKLLAGQAVNDGSAQVLLGKQATTISLNGGDFTVANAQDGGKINFLAPHADGASVTAHNISITAMGGQGMNVAGLNLNATGSIDISASNITSQSVWKQNVTWKAGEHLTVTSDGAVSFLANDNDHGGGNTALSADEDVVITGKNGTVTFNGDGLQTNSGVNITSSNGSVSLYGKVQGGKDKNGVEHGGDAGLTLNKVNITSKNNVTLNGTTYWGYATDLTGLNITAGGDVDISGTAKDDATGNVGNSNKTKGLSINNSNITSTGGNVTVSGLADSGVNAALIINNSNLSANSLMVKGVAPHQGKGFSLTNTHLLGNLQNLSNVTFSSAGSGAGVFNVLDNSIAGNATLRETLFTKNIENVTSIDMNGTEIFNDSKKSDKGWNKDYTHDGKTPGWIFNNTTVSAGGDVTLEGVGFTNSTVSVTSGNLSITNTGLVLLTGTNVTVSNGCVSVHSDAGGIVLTHGNISADKGNILITSPNGAVTGVNIANTIMSAQSVNITGVADGSGIGQNAGGVLIHDSNISSVQDITVSGEGGNSIGVSIRDDNFTAGSAINITGNTTNGASSDYDEFGGIWLGGKKISFNAKTGELTGTVDKAVTQKAGGIVIGNLWGTSPNITFNGSFNIKGKATGHNHWDAGIIEDSSNGTVINFVNGNSTYSGEGVGAAYGLMRNVASGDYTGIYKPTEYINLNNATLKMIFNADKWGAVDLPPDGNINNHSVGWSFAGNGNVSIEANTSNTWSPAMVLNGLDNQNLNGTMSVRAVNNAGDAIVMPGYVFATLVNATITGESKGNGVGVKINAKKGQSNLGNNTVTGISTTGTGISITGNNISLANGTLNGTATSGNGTGVMLSGSSNYTIDGVNVTGKSVDGSGVSVGGALTVNNGTTVDGTSSGKGAGVSVAGTLTTTSGNGVTLKGKSDSGDGVQVAGNTSLTNATLNGTSVSGTGTNINGQLTVSGTSDIKGTSTSGNGLNVAEKVMVPDDETSEVTLTGTSTDKAGVVLGNSVSNSTIKGSSRKGNGVELLSTASVSGGTLTATSVDGTGLQAEQGSQAENVEISAQTVNGQAISGNNNALTTTGNTSISTVGKPGNAGIAENITPVPGSPTQDVAEALGKKLSESIVMLTNTLNMKRADLPGLQQSWSNLKAQLDLAGNTGAVGQPDLERLETVMNGLGTKLSVTGELDRLKKDISSLSSDTGTLDERLAKADVISAGLQGLLPATGDISAVAAELDAAKALQSATVSLQGTLTTRVEESGKVQHLLDSLQQQLKDAQADGKAGGVVLAGIGEQLAGLEQRQQAYGENLVRYQQSLASVSKDGNSPVTSRQESVNRLQTILSGASGVSEARVSALGNQLEQAVTVHSQLVSVVQEQGGVNAQTPALSRVAQDGFHAGGEPPVPVRGYQPAERKVDISLCDGESCRSVSLRADKPTGNNKVKLSGG
ncbi:filamentous hemagglutinin N-terminal domain-containing protein [Salmonella enterica]|nr:filamentous hemagglutinin N-terminal domain-containing protein [Salmonella enterica]EEE0506054.1 filamentous hemagglutinin N-terminal domain-containing protein [Salmonella enterica subsp. enterica serovar Braenderup]EBH7209871.1 filamentous hemagglutinin N-terminal domain-containing protein [Salmonella enterica]EBJ4346324.1 filamentous hemagglutinin N-terminal domain-containing protein [Salmonella enterica]EDC5851861.1 filamentous hemagglutinin N-terminal domain-containing protein [Salmonell